MPYQVLARKWRPQQFSDVIGQEVTLQALSNALEQQRLHHAYLFTGTHGVGKTTIARILAKCLNCEQGVTPTPCGQCQSCEEIQQGRFVDLIEVDAASRTRVEDTRDLLDNVQYKPTRGRYKVYLIDEVHMLSGHSFNALLKTLEEPPAHVIFLLATTDPQKLPVTVLSRCLQFHLRSMTPELIQQQLSHILQEEDCSYEASALQHIANQAKGSMRDALSLLDQAIAYSKGKVDATTVAQMLGLIAKEDLLPLIHALSQRDAAAALAFSEQLTMKGLDLQQVLAELLHIFHQLSVQQQVPTALTAEEQEQPLASLAQQLAPRDLQLFYQIGLLGQQELPLAPDPRIGFEMVLLRMLAFQPKLDSATATAPIPQDKVTTTTKTVTAAANPIEVKNTEASPQLESKQPKTAPNLDLTETPWEKIVAALKLTGLTQMIASHCVLADQQANSIHLHINPRHATMANEKQQQVLAEALSTYLGQPTKVKITPGEEPLLTPAHLAQQRQQQQQNQAEQAINADPNVQTIMQQFNATIEPGSIQPMTE